jgi:hypothetical protein
MHSLFFKGQIDNIKNLVIAPGESIFLFGSHKTSSYRTKIIQREDNGVIVCLSKEKKRVKALLSVCKVKAFYQSKEYKESDPYPREVVVLDNGKVFIGNLDKVDNQMVIRRGSSIFATYQTPGTFWWVLDQQLKS